MSQPDGQITFGKTEVICQSVKTLLKKDFCCSRPQITSREQLILSRQKGRYANVSNAGRDAVDAGGFLDE
jgi:hypothetical protein